MRKILAILYVLSKLIMLFSCTFLAPALVSILYRDARWTLSSPPPWPGWPSA